MAEKPGQIQRPTASQYDGWRKLLLVPLIYGPQADALEVAHHIYHESLTVAGDEGL